MEVAAPFSASLVCRQLALARLDGWEGHARKCGDQSIDPAAFSDQLIPLEHV
jgi:hypothetical protein